MRGAHIDGKAQVEGLHGYCVVDMEHKIPGVSVAVEIAMPLLSLIHCEGNEAIRALEARRG